MRALLFLPASPTTLLAIFAASLHSGLSSTCTNPGPHTAFPPKANKKHYYGRYPSVACAYTQNLVTSFIFPCFETMADLAFCSRLYRWPRLATAVMVRSSPETERARVQTQRRQATMPRPPHPSFRTTSPQHPPQRLPPVARLCLLRANSAPAWVPLWASPRW